MGRRMAAGVGALGVLFLVAGVTASPVPAGNEYTYLVLLEKAADPGFLPGDWTFGSGFQEHAVFNWFLAPVAKIVGIEPLAWIGRVASWLAIALLLIHIGLRLGSPVWVTVIGVWVFLGINQTMGVGTEFLFSHFEAKAIAWPLLLAALLLALDHRIAWASLLVGLAFSFHPAVGLWGGSALLASLLLSKPTRSKTLRWLPLAALAALPGAVPQIDAFFSSQLDAKSAEFLALIRVPHHVDPLSFGERGPLVLLLMLAFNLSWAWKNRSTHAARMLGLMQLLLLIVGVVGVAARLANQHWFLLLHPFRVLPVVVPLIFLMVFGTTLTSLIEETWPKLEWPIDQEEKRRLLVGGGAFVATLLLWNPLAGIASDTTATIEYWEAAPSDLSVALRWLSTETPPDAVVVSPPWVESIFYLSQRSQLVSWEAIPYDRVVDWRDRLDRTVATPAVWANPDATNGDFLAAYRQVDLEQWRSVAAEHGVTHVVTPAVYSIDPVFASGDWRVYSLAAID